MLTVIVGVVVLAAAAFVLSYAGVHDIVRGAGLRTGLARFYPALPDALLVVACAAALALRNARWWARWFAWLTIILLVALVGTADAVHAMAIKLPRRPTAAAVAILPWALLLLGLQLWLSVLRHTRLERPSSAAKPGVAPSAGVAAPSTVPPPTVPSSTMPPSTVPPSTVPPPTVPPNSGAPSPADSAESPSGLDLIMSSHRGEPGGDTDVAADLAVDAEPEPDDPAAGDDGAFDAAGRYHDFAAPLSPCDAEEPDRSEETEYARPLLGAPVPGQGSGKPDQSSGQTVPSNTAPSNTAPSNTAPSNTAPPTTAPPNTAPSKADRPSRPSAATDFRRVRSSPLPPGESED